MNNSNPQFGGNGNFTMYYNFRERFADKQVNPERIGDLGEVSDKFKANARTQYKASAFHDLAADPEKYVAPEMSGTPGREDNKNYTRMEYDEVERNDDKSHSKVMKQVEENVDAAKEVVKRAIGTPKWTVNTTASAFGSMPINQDDYIDENW